MTEGNLLNVEENDTIILGNTVYLKTIDNIIVNEIEKLNKTEKDNTTGKKYKTKKGNMTKNKKNKPVSREWKHSAR